MVPPERKCLANCPGAEAAGRPPSPAQRVSSIDIIRIANQNQGVRGLIVTATNEYLKAAPLTAVSGDSFPPQAGAQRLQKEV
jgi:hypothetical protein